MAYNTDASPLRTLFPFLLLSPSLYLSILFFCMLLIVSISIFPSSSLLPTGLPSLPLLLALVNIFKANVDARDADGLTPLCLAAKLGEKKVAEVSKKDHGGGGGGCGR